MKVICAGMSKTGTKSLHAALEMLGYSVHDYPEAFEFFEKEYTEFSDRGWTVSDFRRMYENIDAVAGGPAYYYWEELVEAFPESKVVLTLRNDDEIWFNSLDKQNTLIGVKHFYYYPLLSPSWRRFWRFLYNSVYLSMTCEKVNGFETYMQLASGAVCKQSYRRHIAHVLHKCPKDRLLVFSCKSGWKPLCEFLTKTVPDKPFPRVNIGGELAKYFWYIDIMKKATKEVRISGGIIALVLVVMSYVTLKKFWR